MGRKTIFVKTHLVAINDGVGGNSLELEKNTRRQFGGLVGWRSGIVWRTINQLVLLISEKGSRGRQRVNITAHISVNSLINESINRFVN